LRVWQLAEEDSSDNREDGRVGSDAECEREQRDDREARIVAKLTKRESDVLSDLVAELRALFMVHPRAIGAIQVSSREFEIAKLGAGLFACRGWRNASVDELLRLHLEMEAQLVIDLASDA
jgi:hypothetical protein